MWSSMPIKRYSNATKHAVWNPPFKILSRCIVIFCSVYCSGLNIVCSPICSLNDDIPEYCMKRTVDNMFLLTAMHTSKHFIRRNMWLIPLKHSMRTIVDPITTVCGAFTSCCSHYACSISGLKSVRNTQILLSVRMRLRLEKIANFQVPETPN